MKLYEFSITMIKKELDSQRNFREIAIATFPLTLEHTVLPRFASMADSGSWSAPAISQSFLRYTNGSWSVISRGIWFSDEDPLLWKQFATERFFMNGVSLFPPVVGMTGEGFVLDNNGARLNMSYEERRREIDLFKWRLTYRGF